METVIVWDVSPVDQVFPEGTEEVSVTLPPEQNVVGPPAVIVGKLLTSTSVAVDASEIQVPIVCVTVYDPEVVTVMDCVVSPVDQVFPVVAEDVSTTLSPSQNVVEPPADIVGAVGPGVVVTTTAGDVLVHQLLNPSVVVTV